MNRKGFTLVELLAVIIILALLALITTTSITKLVSDAKNDLSDTQIKLIESAAKMWGTENIMELPNENECAYITLEELQTYGLIDSKIIDSKTATEIKNLKIKISGKLGKLGNIIRTYELNPDSVEGCKWIYEPKCVAKNITTSESYTVGDLYSCVVSTKAEKYDFYILSDNMDGTVTMLMSENLDGTTSWNDRNKFLTSKISNWVLPNSVSVPSATQLGCSNVSNGMYCSNELLTFAYSNGNSYWTSTEHFPGVNSFYVTNKNYDFEDDDFDGLYYADQDGVSCGIWNSPSGYNPSTDEWYCSEENIISVLYGIRPTIIVDKDKLVK